MKHISLLLLPLVVVGGAFLVRVVDAAVETYFGGTTSSTSDQEYLDWAASARYERSHFMESALESSNDSSPLKGAAIYWSLDQHENDGAEMIRLAVAVQATGWVGFGIGEAGGMLGADIVLYTAATDSLQDTYVLDQPQLPFEDECNDWTLLNSTQTTDGILIFEATRLLDTGDSQDRPIQNDQDISVAPHRVIAAWGDDEMPSFHGFNRARSSIRFHGEGDDLARFLRQMDQEADGYFDVMSSNYPVKPIATEYAYFCFNETDLLEQGVPMNNKNESINIVGYLPIFDSGFVHHALSYGSIFPTIDCSQGRPDGVEAAYGYAPGQGPYSLPANVGGPLGEATGGYRSFLIEVHYNNPQLEEGILDSSGVRFYWSRKVREHQVGVAVMGDPGTNLVGTKTGNTTGIFHHAFHCPGTCSGMALVEQPVTILQEYLHMHATGRRMTHTQVRNGQDLHSASVDYWQFDQQGNMLIPSTPYQAQPGDEFRTECWYEANGEVRFGFSSQDEMCAVFMFYYPRVLIGGAFPWFCGYASGFPGCEADWIQFEEDADSNLGRSFGSSDQDRDCPAAELILPEEDNIQEESPSSTSPSEETLSNTVPGTDTEIPDGSGLDGDSVSHAVKVSFWWKWSIAFAFGSQLFLG